MNAFSLVAEAATIAALAFVGTKMFIDDRRSKAREASLAAAVNEALAAKRDMVLLMAVMRREAEGLKALVEEAESAGEEAAKVKASVLFEAARAKALAEELEGAVSSADRACDRLSSVVKEAAEARKAIVEGEPDIIDEPVPAAASAAPAKASSKVVKLMRRK